MDTFGDLMTQHGWLMAESQKKRFQFSLGSLLLIVTAFSIGFVARNIVDGLHPTYMGLTLPASTSPVRIGEVLLVESLSDSSINREVIVLSDSKISMPLIGTVDVNDQSPAQIQKTLNKSYTAYLRSPQIQVYRASSSRAK